MGCRMRIHSHNAVAVEPIRSAPVNRQPGSVSTTPNAVKPTTSLILKSTAVDVITQ
jgi:hypothetical protein